jgi:hypothetical protein
MVAALKLETRGDPVRGLAVVLLGGFDVTMGGSVRGAQSVATPLPARTR